MTQFRNCFSAKMHFDKFCLISYFPLQSSKIVKSLPSPFSHSPPLPDWHSVSESFHGRMRLIRLGEEEEERGRGSPLAFSSLLSGGCLSLRNTKTWLSSSSSSFPQPNSASSLYAAAEERLYKQGDRWSLSSPEETIASI